MIKLNLLPPEYRKKKKATGFEGVPGVTKRSLTFITKMPLKRLYLYGGGGLLVIYTLAFLGVAVYRHTLNGLNREWERIAPERAKFDRLSREYAEIEATEKAIQNLARPFSWSKKLQELSDSLVWGIWLQELSLGERHRGMPAQGRAGSGVLPEKLLVLTGSAASTKEDKLALVGRFIRSLKENKDFFDDFVEVELDSSKRRSIQTLDVMDFKIICTFREGIIE